MERFGVGLGARPSGAKTIGQANAAGHFHERRRAAGHQRFDDQGAATSTTAGRGDERTAEHAFEHARRLGRDRRGLCRWPPCSRCRISERRRPSARLTTPLLTRQRWKRSTHLGGSFSLAQGIGAYAGKKRDDALDAAKKEMDGGDIAGAEAAMAEYQNWNEGG